ncbi:MAG: cysteine desulfurase family protein [Leadbetterella sp.]
MNARIYLDNAATTAMDSEVLDAMLPYMRDYYGNASSIHTFGRKSKAAIENSRKRIANLLNTSPGEIFFTSGGTEADNMAILKTVEDLGVNHIVSSKLEHHAVLHTLDYLEKNKGIEITYLEHDTKGNLDIDTLPHLLSKKPNSLITLMHANNEIGNFLDIEKVSAIAREYKAIFHSDTVQTMGQIPYNLQTQSVDFIVGSAHKFYGPKGVGFLYINAKNRISPMIHGGAQERNMRGGTENIYAIVGMAEALELALKNHSLYHSHILNLKTHMINALKTHIPNVTFNGNSADLDKSIAKVLNVSFPVSGETDMLLFGLDIEGIACSGGSACSSGTDVGSHVLAALDSTNENANIRFSFGKNNTILDIDKTVEVLKKIILKF